jgi:hypothetical protein
MEPDYGDIASERDDDAAHYELARGYDEEPERTLFDDEAAADLGMHPHQDGAYAAAPAPAPSRLWEEEPEPAPRASVASPSQGRDTGRFGHSFDTGAGAYAADHVASETERPRPAVLPIAVTLILGLLIGFAAGYWTGGREPGTQPPAAATAPAPPPSEPARDSGSGAAANGAGQAYSEQAVGQPSSTPPAIPDDGPPAAAPEPARPAKPAQTSGRLLVTSTPSRASVTVNGRWRGRTPLTLDGLKFGPYSLRVVAPGFNVAREDITLSASNPFRSVALRLQQGAAPAAEAPPGRSAAPSRTADATRGRSVVGSPFAGSVYVDSRPRGARVLIDGKLAGTTPARIPDVSIGSHVVRLELTDHRPWTVSTRVSAGTETRITGSLERIQ